MATKKTAASTKKSVKRPVRKAASAAATTKTRVTTKAAASSRSRNTRFSFSRTPLLAASVAEFIGVFMLASIVLVTSGSPIFVFFGLIAIVIAVGAVSGSHLNPAITVGAWVTRRVDSVRALSYIVAQVLGALLALVVVNGYVSNAPEVSEQAAMYGQQATQIFTFGDLVSGKEWLLLGAELLGTALFAFAFAAVSKSRDRIVAAFGIAGGLFVGLAVAGYLANVVGATGAVLNPALATSVQALGWDLWAILVFVVAPAIGGVIGFGLQDLVSDESKA